MPWMDKLPFDDPPSPEPSEETKSRSKRVMRALTLATAALAPVTLRIQAWLRATGTTFADRHLYPGTIEDVRRLRRGLRFMRYVRAEMTDRSGLLDATIAHLTLRLAAWEARLPPPA